jgi:NADPH-dependent F420 reductase
VRLRGPPCGYEAPPCGYEAPPWAYEAPPWAYEAPPWAYEAPPWAYEAPPCGYERRRAVLEAPLVATRVCNLPSVHVGILGGTGPAGRALAVRLASVGFEVTIGSRQAERAAEVAAQIKAAWPDHALELLGDCNDAAAAADLVVVATPWDSAAATAGSVADVLTHKVVISMANALARVGAELQPLVPPRGSVAAAVQAEVPSSLVAGAFHHVPARELGDLDHPLDGDVLVCSDHSEAHAATAELVEAIPGLRPLNAGSLSSAGPIEAFTAVILNLNIRYRVRSGIRLPGIEVAWS